MIERIICYLHPKGHRWSSHGFTSYECDRCGTWVPAWMVNLGWRGYSND